jgi:signal transduction histidine kinase
MVWAIALDHGTICHVYHTAWGHTAWRVRDRALGLSGLPPAALLPIPFFHTAWFMLLCVVAASGLIWLLFALLLRLRTHQLQARLAERLAERERISRELHDTLLQDVGGLILRFQTAAERIPRDDPTRQMLEDALKQSDEVLEKGGKGFLGYESVSPKPTNCRKPLLRWAWSSGKIIRRILAWW